MKIVAVTTFNRAGWNLYAERMVETFGKHWPADVRLCVYAEDHPDPAFAVPEAMARKVWNFRKLAAVRDGSNGWGEWLPNVAPYYNFRFDAVRFCHKVFAIDHAFAHEVQPGDVLIWIDADVVTLRDVPRAFLDSLIAPDLDVAALLRRKRASETGFIMLRAGGKADELVRRWCAFYEDGSIFGLKEHHDAFIFDVARAAMSGLKVNNLAASVDKGGHPFPATALGQYMDHLKGTTRKKEGFTRPEHNAHAAA